MTLAPALGGVHAFLVGSRVEERDQRQAFAEALELGLGGLAHLGDDVGLFPQRRGGLDHRRHRRPRRPRRKSRQPRRHPTGSGIRSPASAGSPRFPASSQRGSHRTPASFGVPTFIKLPPEMTDGSAVLRLSACTIQPLPRTDRPIDMILRYPATVQNVTGRQKVPRCGIGFDGSQTAADRRYSSMVAAPHPDRDTGRIVGKAGLDEHPADVAVLYEHGVAPAAHCRPDRGSFQTSDLAAPLALGIVPRRQRLIVGHEAEALLRVRRHRVLRGDDVDQRGRVGQRALDAAGKSAGSSTRSPCAPSARAIAA